MTSWYSIQTSIVNVGGGNTIVNYYFSLDTTSNLITDFYNYNNIGVSVLAPSVLPYPFVEPNEHPASNYFNGSTLQFTELGAPFGAGVNFTDTSLQTLLNNNTPYYNYYYNEPSNWMWSYTSGNNGTTDVSSDLTTNYINIQPISGPPSPIPCFLEGSNILTNKGYKKIQDLRKGDLVKTLKHDYKAIDMIGKREIYHPALEERIKDQLYKYSKDNFDEIFEPLIITGCHSILVDNFANEEQKDKTIELLGEIYVTDDKYRLPACADPRATIYEIKGNYTIYHLALENDNYYSNYGIYANGLLVETCSKRYLKEYSNMTLIE